MTGSTTGWEFRLRITHDLIHFEVTPPGGVAEKLPNVPLHLEHLETIRVLSEWLERWEWIAEFDETAQPDPGSGGNRAATRPLLVPETFEVLGRFLWQLALSNEPDISQRLLDAIAAKSAQVRLRVSFEKGAEHLARLPWEFLHTPAMPRRGYFLATETTLVLDRYLPGVTVDPIRQADGKLRVLFIVSLPDRPEFSPERVELRKLKDKLLDPKDHRRIEIDEIDRWDTDAVMERILAKDEHGKPNPVDVVHFIGLCTSTGVAPRLYLPSQGGAARWVDPQHAVSAMTARRESHPAFVVLHLSDWRGDLSPSHFEQVAPQFVERGIPAVLAMQYPMAPDKGWTFVHELYVRLSKGDPIGQAVQEARNKMYLKYTVNRHFGTPVLYMQSDQDGSLLLPMPQDADGDSSDRLTAVGPSLTGAAVAGLPWAGGPAVDDSIQEQLMQVVDGLHLEGLRDSDLAVLNEIQDWIDKQAGDDPAAYRKYFRDRRRQTSADVQHIFTRFLTVLATAQRARES